MKEHTSKYLKTIAYLYLGFPFTYAAYAIVIFDLPTRVLQSAFMTWSYFILSIAGIVTGYGLLEVKRWVWPMYLTTSVGVALANAILAIKYGTSHHAAYAYLLSIVLLFALSFMVSREIRVPYFLPQLKWWETKPRYKLMARASALHIGSLIEGTILDISIGGCFLKTKDRLQIGDLFDLKFDLFQAKFCLKSTVVWVTDATVTHPKGVGIMFKSLDKKDKELLKKACDLLAEYQTLEEKKQKLTESEYQERLTKLQQRSLKSDIV